MFSLDWFLILLLPLKNRSNVPLSSAVEETADGAKSERTIGTTQNLEPDSIFCIDTSSWIARKPSIAWKSSPKKKSQLWNSVQVNGQDRF